jgi:hypothetical protein
MKGKEAICSQCRQAPGMFVIHGHLLCLSCRSRFLQDSLAVDAALARMLNFATSQVELSLGMSPGSGGRVNVPPAPVMHTGPVNLQNINISDSVVGAINTGTVARLDVALTDIKATGDQSDLADALGRFAQVVIDSDLPATQKNELVEQVDFIAEEAKAPPERRRGGVLKAALASIRDVASTVTAFGGAWDQLRPLVERLL